MLPPTLPYKMVAADTGVVYYHCRVCGHLPETAFHPSIVRTQGRQCRTCRNTATYRARMSSEAARILFNFRRRLRRVAPELARRWQLSDVQNLLDNYQQHSSGGGVDAERKLSLIPSPTSDWTTVTPKTARLVTETTARSVAVHRSVTMT